MIADLTRQIDAMDKTILTLIRQRYPEAQFLQQVPGVGPLISLTFVLTIVDPSRFSKSRQVGAGPATFCSTSTAPSTSA